MDKSGNTSEEKAMRIAYLVAGYIQQTLTPQEHDELDRWVEESDENMLLFEQLTDEQNIQAGIAEMKNIDTASAYKSIRKRIAFKKERRPSRLWAYAVAASLLIVAVGGYFFINHKKKDNQPAVIAQKEGDIQPGTIKAILTLGNGKVIELGNGGKGDLINESGLHITKLDTGFIAYSGNPVNSSESNTLTTPRGGQYAVTLSDGTKVWLNAASSLKYPAAFTGNDRKVELDGEAYFEVAHDPSHPFHVASNGQEVTVLGTRFNVNAYADENVVTTTLLQGKIELRSGGERKLVQPGEQYITSPSGIQKASSADAEGSIAWKENIFHFKNAAIEEILKQVSRWYDAKIIYQDTISQHFNADLSRNLPVSKLLRLLEKTGGVRFDIEGTTIKVKK